MNSDNSVVLLPDVPVNVYMKTDTEDTFIKEILASLGGCADETIPAKTLKWKQTKKTEEDREMSFQHLQTYGQTQHNVIGHAYA